MIFIIDYELSNSIKSSNTLSYDQLIVKNNIIYGTTKNGVTGTINGDADIVAIQINTCKKDSLFIDPLNFDFYLQEI